MTTEYRKNVLEFACPHCGGHDLTEIATTTVIRRIRSVFEGGLTIWIEYDDETPQFTIPERVPCPSTKNVTEIFICSHCHRPLTDKDGDVIHDGSLRHWLIKHKKAESASDS